MEQNKLQNLSNGFILVYSAIIKKNCCIDYSKNNSLHLILYKVFLLGEYWDLATIVIHDCIVHTLNLTQ